MVTKLIRDKKLFFHKLPFGNGEQRGIQRGIQKRTQRGVLREIQKGTQRGIQRKILKEGLKGPHQNRRAPKVHRKAGAPNDKIL